MLLKPVNEAGKAKQPCNDLIPGFLDSNSVESTGSLTEWENSPAPKATHKFSEEGSVKQ